MNILKQLADNRSEASLANRLRRKRFQLFLDLLERVPRPLKILDIGGTEHFWHQMQFADQAGVEIVVLNHDAGELAEMTSPSGKTVFQRVIGDACAMPEFADNEFDVIFSNSVLEHVGDFDRQKMMMEEVRRVATRYFVQTPNYYFPIEPHFLVPGFQFLPVTARAFLLQKCNLGWTERVADHEKATQVVLSVRLLSKKELVSLCPGAELYSERVCGVPKSFVAYGGW